MCGIFGYARRTPSGMSVKTVEQRLRSLFKLSETRGKEAAGLAVFSGDRLSVYKDAISASEMLRTRDYQNFLARAFPRDAKGGLQSFAVIGHTRLVTNGSQVVDENNQPVLRDGVALVHNGIVVNHKELWEKLGQRRRKPTADLDSEVLAALVEEAVNEDKATPSGAVASTLEAVFGETSVAYLLAAHRQMILASNTGSLFVCFSLNGNELFFASERYIALEAISGKHALPGFAGAKIEQVKPGETRTIPLFDFATPAAPSVAIGLMDGVTFELKEERLDALRMSMKRCTKCILPETMPYISFDASGVCNYCRAYKSKELRGKDALIAEIGKFKPTEKDGPDCIVSFSGGRDSSYGLHYVVRELGLKPVAYTYDWGMVTDLGRRNQARMCDLLGVEHIWVSADIKKKRANIRRNVLAWMKKPHLGMVPLFMAGDKHYFYFANLMMQKMRIPNLLMCSNHLEATHFKAGFSGVRPKILAANDKTEHMHQLPMAATAKMASFYGGQFVANPSYVNASVWDTLEGAASYYIMKQPHLDIFDYIEWRESEIEKQLLSHYDWEIAADADTTWRIGDGTAPFYNYIYMTVAGLTEFDTFRSNQIREGHITRDEALELIKRDNAPRWPSMRDYFSMINVDIADAVRAVSRMPKLYERAA